MKILVGTGNAISTALDTSAKTLSFSGAYNFDIVPDGNFSVYSSTASKWLWGGGTTGAVPGTTAVRTTSLVAGLTVQIITFNQIPSGVANGDTLIIYVDCPDSIADYNSVVTT